jgi:SpoU rRNA methylase family enzyme
MPASRTAEELEHGRLLIAEVIGAQAQGGITPEVRSLAKDVGAELEADAKRAEDALDAVYVCCFAKRATC